MWLVYSSGVYVKKCSSNVKKDEHVMKICPLHFNMHGKYVHDNGDLSSHENDTWRNTSIPPENDNSFQKAHDNGHLLSADVNSISESMSEQKVLIKHWLIGQLKEMGFRAENSETSSVVLPAKVLVHFEVVDGKLSRRSAFIYLLTIAFENPGYNNSQGNIEITWNTPTDDPENLELNFGRLELGEAISIDSVLDDCFNDAFKLTRSSLGWMDSAMSDVTKSIVFH
jgi:peroxin-1